MAQYQARPVLDTVDPVWARVRHEAEEVVRREPYDNGRKSNSANDWVRAAVPGSPARRP